MKEGESCACDVMLNNLNNLLQRRCLYDVVKSLESDVFLKFLRCHQSQIFF